MTAPSPTNEPGGPSTVDDQPSPKRWSLLFLLFLSIMINLIDRQVLSVMAPVIRDELGLTNADYSQILFAFLLGLTLFQYPAGWMIDRKGPDSAFRSSCSSGRSPTASTPLHETCGT